MCVWYLYGGKHREIAHTIVNALAIDSGIICDGAKSSCAAKIASAVEAGLLGMEMYKHGSQFYGGDGIVTKGVENTIKNVGRLAKYGMAQTDKEIILGVAFQTHPGRQAFLSSGSKEARSALESRRVSLGAHWVDSRESSLLRRLERGREIGR